MRFYDLETGVTATYELGLQPGYGDVTVSPGGEFMMIQHDLTSNPTDSDVDVLRLCNLAAISKVQGQPPTIDNMSIVGINAHVAASGGGQAILEVRDGTGAVRWDASAACCSSGAPVGACCTGTTCSITIQAACGGVWSAGQTCAQVGCGATPPAVDALINAPATMAVNASAPMSVVVTNSGGTAASNVQVILQSPSYQVISFASPGQGGVLGDRAGADKQVLRQPLDDGHERGRQHQPTQPPAGHIEVFAEAVDADDVLIQRQRAAAIAVIEGQG
jgi:hypothetical protein